MSEKTGKSESSDTYNGVAPSGEEKGVLLNEKQIYDKLTASRSRTRSNVLEGFQAIEYTIIGDDKLETNFLTPDQDGTVEWTHELKEDDSSNRVIARHLSRKPQRGDPVLFPTRLAGALSFQEAELQQPITDSAGVISISHNPNYLLLLQTPLDDGPFFCLLMRQHSDREFERFNFTGLISYANGDTFAPENIFNDDMFMVRWRWGRIPSFAPVIGFLRAQDEYISTRLEFLHKELLSIEEKLIIGAANTTSPDSGPDFGYLTKRLQIFGTSVSNLSRRQHFQRHVMGEMLTMLQELADPTSFMQLNTAKVDPLKSSLKAREYDLEMLPKREQIAKTTMFNLIVQRDQAMSIQVGRANLEMAQNSAAIAEATMRESAAMSTIAIMTMIFLPATAVASIFGMTMFNWSPGGNVEISRYIWVYFLLSAVLTLFVILIWWFWTRSREKMLRKRISSGLV